MRTFAQVFTLQFDFRKPKEELAFDATGGFLRLFSPTSQLQGGGEVASLSLLRIQEGCVFCFDQLVFVVH